MVSNKVRYNNFPPSQREVLQTLTFTQQGITSMNSDGYLAKRALEDGLPQVLNRYGLVVKFIRSTLQEDIDYGKIPGCGDKPTLLLPGAQKLAQLFRLSVRVTLDKEEEDWTGKEHNNEPFFAYRHRCEVYDQHNNIVATGYGSCNSWEKKYRWREAKRRCPRCSAEAIRKSKDVGGGYYCWGKIGGCGAKFEESDPAITSQKNGLVPNPEIFDSINTLLKMSAKRAYVCGILYAAGISEFFSQDLSTLR